MVVQVAMEQDLEVQEFVDKVMMEGTEVVESAVQVEAEQNLLVLLTKDLAPPAEGLVVMEEM